MPAARDNEAASAATKDKPRQSATLFIRNLHPATSSEQLDAHFAGIGPLRRAFVVTDRQTGESRRVAFVKYATPAHAAAARDALHHSTLTGRRIDVQPARSKRDGDEASGDAGRTARRSAKLGKGSELGAPPMRTVVLRRVDGDAPDETAVLAALEKGGLKESDVRVVVAEAGAVLRLTFASWSVAGRAAAVLHACKPYTAAIDALVGSSRATVIVRNLPFSVDRIELRNAFAAAAPVRDVRVAPRKEPLKGRDDRQKKGGGKNGDDDVMDDGNEGEAEANDEDMDDKGNGSDRGSDSDSDSDGETARVRATAAAEAAATAAAAAAEAAKTDVVGCAGYAFVEFFLVADAKHAMQKLNGSKIGGRVVAVDLVVERSDYKARKARAADAGDEEDGEEVEVADDDDETQENGAVEDGSNGEEKSGSDDDKDEGEEVDENEDKNSTGPNAKKDATEDGRKQRSANSSPEELGRTVFVRNLLFETSAEELRTAMHKAYGPVEKALIVMHKVTRRPRGTAFVRFKAPGAAERAVAASGPEVGEENAMVLDGRKLLLTLAVDRGSADRLRGTGQKESSDADAEKNKEKEKDPRNMHLAWVGKVRRNSSQAAGMSEQDFVRREKAETEKEKKLSHNPNAFVSDVRLSVRNLPRDMDEKTFKQMFLVAARTGIAEKRERKREDAKKKRKGKNAGEGAEEGAGEGEVHAGEDVSVTHCKIIRNEERNGRSKCFGFIQFARHDAAIHALQKLNNNANAMDWMIGQKPRALRLNEQREKLLREMWGDRRRMLVEFAVEDRRMVRRIESIKMRGRQKSEEVRAARENANGAATRGKKGRKRGRGRETGLDSGGGENEGETRSWKRRRAAEADNKAEDQSGETETKTKATPKSKRNFVHKLRRQRRLAKQQ